MDNGVPIGGINPETNLPYTVEVDESKFGKIKHHRVSIHWDLSN
jgi:hypothetical protein